MILRISVPTSLSSVLCLFASCGGGSKSGSGGGGSFGPTTETSPHPPIHTRYVRTDIQYNPNALQFFPPHVTAYDSVHKRFFISNTTLNHIKIFEAHTRKGRSAQSSLPDLQALTFPEQDAAVVRHDLGDVTLIDAVERCGFCRGFHPQTIGPQGYIASQVFIMADGRWRSSEQSVRVFYSMALLNFAI